MTRQVRMLRTVTGRSHRDKRAISEMDSKAAHACLLNQVAEHFGEERPVHITTRDSRTVNSISYPEFYAAGWFASDNPITGTESRGSELVVISHGDSMEQAQVNLMVGVQSVAWDELAKNII